MCCACGGGDDGSTPVPTPITAAPTFCTSTGGDATDPYGDGCDAYSTNPGWCGLYDDSDYSSEDMCCVCGGGSSSAVPTTSPAPTVPPAPTSAPTFCFDNNMGATNQYGGDCNSCPITCFGYSCDYWGGAGYTCAEMESSYACECNGCVCAETEDATDDACPSTCFGYACDYWSNTCAELESAYGCDCSGCSCESSSSSDDDAGICGGDSDDSDFTASDMCCVCGGGSNSDTALPTVSPPSPQPTFAPTACHNTDSFAVDSSNVPCVLYDNHPENCGEHDDSDFTSTDMCCACGGGDSSVPPTTSPAPTPDGCYDTEFLVDSSVITDAVSGNADWSGLGDGFCEFFEENPWKCGGTIPGNTGYRQTSLCCACGGGEMAGSCPAVCTDPPGSTCDSFPEMTRAFREASGCPDCGGCQNECGNDDKKGNGLCEQVALAFASSSDLNSDECSYDGGDCCPDTCVSQPFEVPVGARTMTIDSCGVYGWDCRNPTSDQHPQVCEDTDELALDKNGDGCAIYAFDTSRCESALSVDEDFNARVMCCACGGGNVIAEAPNHVGTTQTFVFDAYVQKNRGPQRFYLNTTRVDLNRLYAASYGCPLSEVTTADPLNNLAQSVDLKGGKANAPIDTLFNPRAMARGAYAGRVALNPSFIGNIDRSYECTQFLGRTDKDSFAERASTGVLASVLDDFAGIKDQDVYAKDFGEDEISASISMIQVRGWPSMVDLSYAAPYNAFKNGRRIELLLRPAIGPWQETFDSFGYIFFLRVLPFLIGLSIGAVSAGGLIVKRSRDKKKGLQGKQKKFLYWLFGHPTHHVMFFEGIAAVWVGIMHLLCGHGPATDWLPDAMRTWLLQTRASGMGLYTTLVMVRPFLVVSPCW